MKAKVLMLLGLLATLFASVPAFAQSAYYFHFKDGSMQVFYTDWVDSMSVSKVDLEGVEHEEFVTQQIWMNDTVFSCALAEIDSVSFVTPKTIYQPGVIKMEDGLDRYVVAHDSMTISLDSATPLKMIPRKGDKLVYLQMTDMFPNGFAGEVIDIKDNKLECGLVDLSEVFVQYYSTSSPSVQTRASGSVSFKGIWQPGALPFPLDWLVGADEEGDDELENACGFSFGNDFSGEITPVVEVRGFMSVTPQMGTYVCVSSTGKYDLNEKIELSGGFNAKFQKDFLSVSVPLNTPLLQAYVRLYGYFNLDVSASLSASFNQQFRSAFLYNICSKVPAPMKNQPLTIRKSAASSSCVGVSLSGNAEAGIGGEIGIKVADKVLRKDDEAKIYAKFEAGAKMEGEVSFTKAELDNAAKTTDLYDNLKDKEIKANIVYGAGVGADLELEVLNLNKNFEIGFSKESPEPFFKRSFVPLFAEKPIVERKDDKPSVLSCTSSLGNDCLIPVSVGHAVYYNGELVATNFYDEKYTSQDKSFEKYQTEFEWLSTSKKYTVAPLVKLFGFEMMASPSSEVDRCVTVSTNPAQNIKYSSADILGTVKGYDACFERPTVGFYYGTKDAFHSGNGITVYASLAKDLGSDQFKITLSGLQDKTTYYYVAFVENNIDDVIYGDTLSFTTLEREIDDGHYFVVTCDAENVTDKSATLHGLFHTEYPLGYDDQMGFYYGSESDFNSGCASKELVDIRNSVGGMWDIGFEANLSNLKSETTYFFVAFASNAEGIFFGDTLSFTTEEKRIDETPYYAPLSYFYKTSNGDAWTQNYGWNDTTKLLAKREWYGLELSAKPFGLDMNLRDNNLSGNAVIKNLKNLSYLNLSENDFQSLTLDCDSLIYQNIVIENNRASSPLNLEMKDSKCNCGLDLQAKGTKFDNIVLKGNDFSYRNLYFDVDKVNNLSISGNKNVAGLLAYRGYEKIFLDADKISLIDNSINETTFTINNIKASSFVMDNCTTDTYDTQVYFGECTIDEVSISGCSISGVNVDSSSSIKVFKLSDMNYKKSAIYINNSSNVNFYISNCRISDDECMFGNGTGMFYITSSWVGGYYISEFSGTASELQNYLQNLSDNSHLSN